MLVEVVVMVEVVVIVEVLVVVDLVVMYSFAILVLCCGAPTPTLAAALCLQQSATGWAAGENTSYRCGGHHLTGCQAVSAAPRPTKSREGGREGGGEPPRQQ